MPKLLLDLTKFDINNNDVEMICTLLLATGEAELYEKINNLYEAILENQKPDPVKEDQIPLPFHED